ncbi:MAG: hypothetical protein M3Q49_04720 [Actinomycetota bacterium]|nr:hypothetical protein [Actinomycetota bacterium]
MLANPSDPSARAFVVSSTCRSCASCRTVAMIFSILTHISQPAHFCSSVARLRQTQGS